jgi:hypothetical protein
MITKIQYKLGAMSKRFGRFPNAADVQATYAQTQKVAVSAKDKAVKFGSQAKEKLYKANEVVSKHMAKNPKKYAAGATAVAGVGVYSEYQKQKNDGTHAKIKKHLKSKGYVE